MSTDTTSQGPKRLVLNWSRWPTPYAALWVFTDLKGAEQHRRQEIRAQVILGELHGWRMPSARKGWHGPGTPRLYSSGTR